MVLNLPLFYLPQAAPGSRYLGSSLSTIPETKDLSTIPERIKDENLLSFVFEILTISENVATLLNFDKHIG